MPKFLDAPEWYTSIGELTSLKSFRIIEIPEDVTPSNFKVDFVNFRGVTIFIPPTNYTGADRNFSIQLKSSASIQVALSNAEGWSPAIVFNTALEDNSGVLTRQIGLWGFRFSREPSAPTPQKWSSLGSIMMTGMAHLPVNALMSTNLGSLASCTSSETVKQFELSSWAP